MIVIKIYFKMRRPDYKCTDVKLTYIHLYVLEKGIKSSEHILIHIIILKNAQVAHSL